MSRQLWIYNVHHATRFLPLSLSLSTINIGVSTWTWFFFFPRPFILTYRHVFFPSLSPLLQRGRSKATLCSFRKAACSTTFTIRRNAGNLTGKQTDEKGREDEATWEYRFTCSPQRNSIHRWSLVHGGSRFDELRYPIGKVSLSLSEWIFLDFFEFFFFF